MKHYRRKKPPSVIVDGLMYVTRDEIKKWWPGFNGSADYHIYPPSRYYARAKFGPFEYIGFQGSFVPHIVNDNLGRYGRITVGPICLPLDFNRSLSEPKGEPS